MKNINDLIVVNQAQAQAKADKTRFMLELDTPVRDRLTKLCEKMGTGQIKFASELFTLALGDAEKAYEEAVKAQAEAKKAAEQTVKK